MCQTSSSSAQTGPCCSKIAFRSADVMTCNRIESSMPLDTGYVHVNLSKPSASRRANGLGLEKPTSRHRVSTAGASMFMASSCFSGCNAAGSSYTQGSGGMQRLFQGGQFAGEWPTFPGHGCQGATYIRAMPDIGLASPTSGEGMLKWCCILLSGRWHWAETSDGQADTACSGTEPPRCPGCGNSMGYFHVARMQWQIHANPADAYLAWDMLDSLMSQLEATGFTDPQLSAGRNAVPSSNKV